MTEDMRERFEKWHVDKFGYVPIWNRSRQQYAGRSREMAEIWQAALSSAGTSGTPSAPDRAEELAWEISDMFNDRGRNYDNQPTVDELASLLREASDKCPTCGLTIVPRLCANPACASSVRR